MSKRILVIDDEPILIDLLTHLLVREGHQVDQAGSGLEGLKKVQDNPLDAIFVDIRMPDINGTDFYLKVKEKSIALAKRTVFVTGDIANSRTMDFLRETGNLYLVKPFQISSVKGILEKLFPISAQ